MWRTGQTTSLRGTLEVMAKQFKDFKSACDWLKNVCDATADKTRPAVAEQLYKDSNEFTYRESGEMYKSGATNSDFQKGYVIERSPYVRRRYYEGGKPGAGNRKAEPRWFDKTWNKYKEDYQGMCVTIFNKEKEK